MLILLPAQSKKNIVSGIKFVQKSIRKGDHNGFVFLIMLMSTCILISKVKYTYMYYNSEQIFIMIKL